MHRYHRFPRKNSECSWCQCELLRIDPCVGMLISRVSGWILGNLMQLDKQVYHSWMISSGEVLARAGPQSSLVRPGALWARWQVAWYLHMALDCFSGRTWSTGPPKATRFLYGRADRKSPNSLGQQCWGIVGWPSWSWASLCLSKVNTCHFGVDNLEVPNAFDMYITRNAHLFFTVCCRGTAWVPWQQVTMFCQLRIGCFKVWIVSSCILLLCWLCWCELVVCWIMKTSVPTL